MYDERAIEALLKAVITHRRNRRTYAVLDGARGIDVPKIVRQCGVQCRSLYSGRLGNKLADVAPYLCQLEADSPLLRWLARQWGNSVAVLLQTALDFDALWAHLRSELVVATDASNQKFLLRFYDPRVLGGFLEKASKAEAESFFGPIQAWCCEDTDARHLLTFAPQADGVFIGREPVPVLSAVGRPV